MPKLSECIAHALKKRGLLHDNDIKEAAVELHVEAKNIKNRAAWDEKEKQRLAADEAVQKEALAAGAADDDEVPVEA